MLPPLVPRVAATKSARGRFFRVAALALRPAALVCTGYQCCWAPTFYFLLAPGLNLLTRYFWAGWTSTLVTEIARPRSLQSQSLRQVLETVKCLCICANVIVSVNAASSGGHKQLYQWIDAQLRVCSSRVPGRPRYLGSCATQPQHACADSNIHALSHRRDSWCVPVSATVLPLVH